MNFCERLREIRNELKNIEVMTSHSIYNLSAYCGSIRQEIDRIERNGSQLRYEIKAKNEAEIILKQLPKYCRHDDPSWCSALCYKAKPPVKKSK